MKVLFASAEMVPFAKAGGLGDVIGSLPKALRREGIDARVLMPMYGFVDRARAAYNIEPAFNYQFTKRNGTADVIISMTEYDSVPVYFLASWPFFGEGGHLYTTIEWDMPRFVFFCQTVMATVWQLSDGAGGHEPWFPDVLHLNDWHTALAAFLLDYSRDDPDWAEMGSVLTLHNMAYQGNAAGGWLFEAGIPGRHHPDLVSRDLTDNLLACGLAYADMISTVSPRYAIEMQYPRFGEGLEDLIKIRSRRGEMMGILNGLDVERWNPATDPWIEYHFTPDNFLEKRPPNKALLQQEAGLPVRADVPLIGIVTRLVDQKGIDLAIPALRQLLSDTDVQLIVLGTGDKALELAVWRLCNDFRSKARAFLQFDAILSQRIYSGSDLFLLPSRYEPCGTGQMLALHYGCLPIVRETGGLADTVQNYDNGNGDVGTGFVFLWETPEAILGTVRWAIDIFENRHEVFQKMQHRGMLVDFSWHKSAGEYVAMYERILSQRHRALARNARPRR